MFNCAQLNDSIAAHASSSAAYSTNHSHPRANTNTQFWKKYAAEASRQQISIDAFCFSAAYTDLASIGALPKYTCGGLYYYPGFNAPRDAAKLEQELSHNLTRETGWEAVCRIRCSKGLKVRAARTLDPRPTLKPHPSRCERRRA